LTTPAPPTSPARTKGGELRAKVARLLADRPADALTIGDMARQLGHSHGAVRNATHTLVRRGEADQSGSGTGQPQFRANAKTAAAAQTAVISPPGTHTPRAQAATARTTIPAAATPRRTGPIRRPGGQVYHPRELADLPDVEALNRLRDADVPVLLYGPPGTGKTSLVEAAFPDLLTVAGDGDTTVGDLIGEYTQDDGGGYVFQYGPLVTAMTEGRALLIDDATLISPKVLAALYPAMDGRRQIQVKAHKGETIKAESGFYVVAGHNPGVHGAVLTEALASRFSVQIQIGTDYDLAAALRIDARVVRAARRLAREAVLGTNAALANLVGIAPAEDRDAVAEAVIKTVGVKKIAPLTLGRQLPAPAVRQPPGSTGSAHPGRSR
jgi:MoxR-like ATPase